MIEQQIKAAVRDIPDFPKPGIVFKDVTTILKDPQLCQNILDASVERFKDVGIDAVAGVESRGFLFGLMLAMRLNVPFIPIRKAGKLPYSTRQKVYELEYGTATVEVHTDAFEPGSRILVHDDLLATGGTVTAASELITDLGGVVAGFSFIIGLDFLNGAKRLQSISPNIVVLASYA
jgi:adenine phosphoribosyltransferase